MAKTGKGIQSDIIALLKSSGIVSLINGTVYHKGIRPRDSQLEDIVVEHTTGIPTEIQEGVVTIKLYVPNTDFNGVSVEDGERTCGLESALQTWVDNLSCRKSGYKFKQQFTVTTEKDDETNQHFVVVMLRYEYYGDGSPVGI